MLTCRAEDHSLRASPASGTAVSDGRLLSIDALRGFAMLWLIGARELALSLVAWQHPPWFDAWETQLTHPAWHGPVAWDLVMPVFLFVVGTAMPLAMAKRRRRSEPLEKSYRRIACRVALLWAVGMLLQALKPDTQGLELYSNPLQAIAVGYLVASLALLHLSIRGQAGLLALLVLGYGALLLFVPFPGYPAGLLERRLNLSHFIDELVLGSFRRDHSFAWILPSLGFAATVLLGAMAGHLLCAPLAAKRRLLLLLALGSGCMAAGWLWSAWLPLNRYLWTSSLILWAGGISFWLTALFHGVIDVGKIRSWAFPLMVIGANALLAYGVDPLVIRLSEAIAATLGGPDGAAGLNIWSPLLEMTCLWLLLWLLYRKGIFFRI